MEGPQFSTKAESNLYRSWGMDVIGMTNLQEAKLAREAELCYATVAMVTDYDCWHPEHDAVTVEQIIAVLNQNAENACNVVREAVAAMPRERTCKCGSALAMAIITAREAIPAHNPRALEADHRQICRRSGGRSERKGGSIAMSILVVGSVAFDTLKTAYGERREDSGRFGNLFFAGGQLFHQGARGRRSGRGFHRRARRGDEGARHRHHRHRARSGKTFHWGGEYGENLNEAKTNFTDLNVFQNFRPRIPEQYADTSFLFLANIDPALQLEVRRQMPKVKLVGGDTMNLWINISRPQLNATLKEVDILLINDGEAKLLAAESSLPKAARKVLEMGPRALVIKHGEYGATIFFRDGIAAPVSRAGAAD